jgi:predicted ATPase
MRIERLDIEGYRSLKKVSWSPGDLNIVIGPNGTGKSNLLRFLELIALSAQGRLSKHIQSLGGMDSLVWDGVASSIKFTLETAPVGDIWDPERYELELARLGTGSSYRVEREFLADFFKVRR